MNGNYNELDFLRDIAQSERQIAEQGGIIDTDPTLAGNSDARVPSQKAVKSYVDGRTSTYVIYASAIGCHLNSDVLTGGGTDDTVAIQAALDLLESLGGGTFIQDGPSLISDTLLEPSDTTILALNEECGAFLANGSNCVMVKNKGITIGTRTDKNISIIGGTWNGNGPNQSLVQDNGAGGITMWNYGFQIVGCDGVVIRDVNIVNSKTYAFLVGNFSKGRFYNLSAHWDTDTVHSDGFHVLGPWEDLELDGMVSNGIDDTVGLNGDEVGAVGTQQYSSGHQLGGRVRNVRNLNPNNLRGVRVNTIAARTEGIVVENCEFVTSDAFLMMDNEGTIPDSYGNVGDVTFRNFKVTMPVAASVDNVLAYINVNTESFVWDNIQITGAVDDRPAALFRGHSMGKVAINGLKITDPAGQIVNTAVSDAGLSGRIVFQCPAIKSAMFSDAIIERDSALTRIPFLRINQGAVGPVQLNNFIGNRLDGVVSFDGNGGSVAGISGVNITDTDQATASFITAATIPRLAVCNYVGGTLSSGTFTSTTGA